MDPIVKCYSRNNGSYRLRLQDDGLQDDGFEDDWTG